MLNEADVINMYMKAGFTREQAIVLNDVAVSLIVSVRNIIEQTVDKKVSDVMIKSLRHKN